MKNLHTALWRIAVFIFQPYFIRYNHFSFLSLPFATAKCGFLRRIRDEKLSYYSLVYFKKKE